MGEIEPNFQENNISVLINRVLQETELIAGDKNLQILYINYTNNLVVCDKEMIYAVLNNLMTNAIKFSDKDSSIIIKVDNYANDGAYIQVSFIDKGIGIEQESIKKLLNLDSKISTRGTTGEFGTGLGLILCKEYINKHNCSI